MDGWGWGGGRGGGERWRKVKKRTCGVVKGGWDIYDDDNIFILRYDTPLQAIKMLWTFLLPSKNLSRD